MLSNQIKLFRKKAGMSQLQLAKKLNIAPSAIGMYEQGRRTPSIKLLIDRAGLFDVSLDYLTTGQEDTYSTVEKNKGVLQSDCHCKACECCYKRVLDYGNQGMYRVFECGMKTDTAEE